MWFDWAVIVAAFGYIGFLFAVASYGDRRARHSNRAGLIYPLSLAIYCTSWTYFGSVGFAARTSTDFLAIYVGPILMFTLGVPLLRRVIKLTKSQNISSIADFIAGRYGKSQAVAATVAFIAIVGSIPYIALQLKALAASLKTILSEHATITSIPVVGDLALIVTIAMAMFAMLFGTRHTNATEHQHGLMLAVATESIVKLAAFLAVGAVVTFWIFSPAELLEMATQSPEATRMLTSPSSLSNFLTLTLLSFFAIMLLPRQFHVGAVENANDAELRRARWLFPLYLVAINLFVIPIAAAGLIRFPFGAVDSDMYVLALPVDAGIPVLSIIVFIGGLSAATAMVIVECVALAIMVSNDIVLPLLLRRSPPHLTSKANFGILLQRVRRVAICAIMFMAYLYYLALEDTHLVAIGLLSFAAVAQFAPAFFGGLIWRRGTARGAIAGMVTGFITWAYTLFIPSLLDSSPLGSAFLMEGPFAITWLRPQALMGMDLPPLVHGVLWSLSLNMIAYVLASLMRQPKSMEQVQADLFVPQTLVTIAPTFRRWRSTLTVNDIQNTVAQYLGQERAKTSFVAFAAQRGIDFDPKAPADFELLQHAEHLIASTIGAASSRLVMSLLLRRRTVSAKAALRLLDDSHAALHFNREMLQSALNHMRQGIAVFNSQQELICFNRQFADLLDLPQHFSQIGLPLAELVTFLGSSDSTDISEPGIRFEKKMRAFTTDGKVFLQRFADRRLVIEVRANHMPDSALVLTFSDVTPSFEAAEALERANATLEKRVRERTQQLMHLNSALALAKSQAEEANQSKTRFLAAASHDILQPLNAARIYVTSLADRQHGGEDARLVGNINDSLEAVEEILGALLDISRLEAGAMLPSIANFNIGDLFRSLEIEFSPIAQAKSLNLTFVPSSQTVRSDRVMLRRLLQNLISNAIKYTQQGRVLIGCRRTGSSIQICVYDTGLGIPPTKRSEIFKEFHRLDQGARIARGLGLGLSIVDRLARVLNHGIAIEGNRNNGSKFSVTLPSADSVTLVSALTSTTPLTPPAMRDTTIVCIENDPAILDGMKTMLTGWGVNVIAAPNKQSAVTAIAASSASITGLLVDYHLDQGNGLGAIQDIREQFGAHIPAILITADRSPHLRNTASGRNISIVNKPLRPSALRALLGQWSTQRALRAEN